MNLAKSSDGTLFKALPHVMFLPLFDYFTKMRLKIVKTKVLTGCAKSTFAPAFKRISTRTACPAKAAR